MLDSLSIVAAVKPKSDVIATVWISVMTVSEKWRDITGECQEHHLAELTHQST